MLMLLTTKSPQCPIMLSHISKPEEIILKRILALSFLFFSVVVLVRPEALRASHKIEMDQDEAYRVGRGQIVLREISSTSVNGKTFEAVATIPATYQQSYDVLMDFDKYHQFMPNVSSADVLRKDSEEAVVDYVLDLPLGRTKKYRLKLEFYEDDSSAHISWSMIDSPGLTPKETIKDTSGYWMLMPYPGRPEITLALYHVFTDPGEVPLGMEWIIELLSEKSLPKTIKQTRKRVAEIYD